LRVPWRILSFEAPPAVLRQRLAERAARADDPGFALSKSEAGHPLWGPVWQRVRQ
jgi:predicted kinase